ncbi:MAG: rhodanese-like domain-containing protein [Bacteroidia bacterium]|nr:rhodanese-like domain-containing protein [Bacteroidia bacterium]
MRYIFHVALLISIGLIACTGNKHEGVQQISPDGLEELLANENTVLIDVRTPEEVATGYIPGATLFIDAYSDDFESRLLQLDKDKTYAVYCLRGGRSARATDLLASQGFSSVYNVEGGIDAYTGRLIKN